MATITNTIAAFNGDQVRVELDYNDANRRMTKGRVINNSAFPCWLRVFRASGSPDFSFTVDAGQTVERNLPAGLVYQWIDDPNDETMGNGLSLGDITIQARFPA